MSDAEVNSTNSFVDIIANTTGMIIKLTLLAMLLGHQQSLKVDDQAKRLDVASTEAVALRTEQVGLPDHLAAAQRDLSQLRQRIEETEVSVARVDAELRGANARIGAQEAELARLKPLQQLDVQARAARTLAVTQQIAEVEAAQPAALRTLVDGGDATTLADRRKQAEGRIPDLQQRLAGLRSALTADQAALVQDEARQQADSGALQSRRERLVHDLDVRRPASSRPYGSRPILVECYRDAGGIDRIRLLTEANYRRDGAVWVPLREGAAVSTLEQAADLQALLAQKADGKRYLYLMVRADAYAGFRVARAAAEQRGWWVEWDPLEPGTPLNLGGTTKATMNASNVP